VNRRTITAMTLALLVPGAGHLYLGRRVRAAIFFTIIVFLFIAGIGLDGRLYTTDQPGPLAGLATLGSMGAGVLYLVTKALGHVPVFGYSIAGDYGSMTFEYGTAFALTAGLMNLLLIVDVFDIAEGRKP
jgi:hypothetical protein